MKKKLKTTAISFNEADPTTTIYTYNTKLKKRLLEFSEECPDLCKGLVFIALCRLLKIIMAPAVFQPPTAFSAVL